MPEFYQLAVMDTGANVRWLRILSVTCIVWLNNIFSLNFLYIII